MFGEWVKFRHRINAPTLNMPTDSRENVNLPTRQIGDVIKSRPVKLPKNILHWY
jgi:hypothetical protein